MIDELKNGKYHMGFLKTTQLNSIICENPNEELLVRTYEGSFLCHAKDAKLFIAQKEAKGEYLKDISFKEVTGETYKSEVPFLKLNW